MVYYSMNNLRGRLGSTRQVRGLGCDTDSSIFGPRHPELILVENGGLAAVIEGEQRHCNSEAYAMSSDLSRSSTSERFDARLHGAGINDEENAGRYSIRMSGSEAGLRPATSWSGEGYGLLVVSAPDNTAPHYPRNHGNPCAEKVRPHRPRQKYRCAPRSVRHHERPLPWKASRLRDLSAGFWQDVPEGHRSGGSERGQGMLTITGSNVRLGTEMPVALSLSFV
jgi:hypothetical protein